MKVSLIAALDHDFAIGKGNMLPWQLPDDLKRFKALTLGKPILMGRKTAQSLGRALPGRLNLVLTRSRERRDRVVTVIIQRPPLTRRLTQQGLGCTHHRDSSRRAGHRKVLLPAR